MTLTIGDPAPDFTLFDHRGKPISLSKIVQKGYTIVYFYPRDFSPHCTKEACEWKENFPSEEITEEDEGVTI
ncbi:Peroxiredoxin, partial [Planoprotostelium fungivorum]